MLSFLGRLTAAIVAVLLPLQFVRAAETWQAGVARANITPEGYMWMAGYAARTRPADSKMTDLWAKALVLEDGAGKRAVLITLDLVGIDRDLSNAIRDELKQKHGLAREQIALNCSHTHSGPVVARNLRPMHFYALEKPQQQLVRQYADKLHATLVELTGQAIAALAPAELSWASGITDFAVNRRNNKEPAVPMLREAGTLVGPSDHDVPVLAVKAADGSLLAVAFGYACHATVLDGYEWSGDYPGYAQIELEKAHPGTVALFWAGCGADQNPIPRRKRELAETYGKQLGQAVTAVLAGPLTPIAPRLATSYAEVDLPFADVPTKEELVAQTEDTNKYIVMRAKMLLEDLAAGQPVLQSYPYPVQSWRLGSDVQWCFLGGEVVVDYAIRLKAEYGGIKTWVAGYTNDVCAYIPSRRVLLEGGYEGGGAMVYYGLPSAWTEEVESRIDAEVQRQMPAAE
ncbi:MAG: neutral/alkaline non-lysosomal ceramidase N-terminal domain-containing protein [Pirellulaceae bacterium]